MTAQPLETVRSQIVSLVRDFVRRDVLPVANRYDNEDIYPAELAETMRQMGLFGITIPEEYGGLGLDHTTFAMVFEELSKGWMSVSGIIGTHHVLASILFRDGTDEQKSRLLPRMASGEVRGGLALTEPEAGTDVQAIQMTAVKDGDAEFLWIADNGRKRTPATGYEYPDSGGPTVGQVVKMSMDGETVMRLPTPPVDAYRTGDYMPTWVAVNEERHGGNGDVWVTDGYAADLIHRYDKSGNYVTTITGEEGRVGKFNNPHAVMMDTRKSEPELYVADRGNGQIQVYDADGVFKRAFGGGDFIKPSGLTLSGDRMVVADLNARLSVIDADDVLICHLGDNHEVTDVKGWPNNVNEDGDKVRPGVLKPGRFNSPHGIAADHHSNIYVAEWLIGGRYVKLAVE